MEEQDRVASEIQFDECLDRMRQCIGQIIVGQHKNTDLLLTAIIAGGHVLLEGVPGVAKTLSARLVAKLIDAQFSRVQFTSDIMPSDILGTNVFNMSSGNFDFHAGPIFADIVLVDEINRAPAKTQSALFEVMEERQASIDGTVYPMSDIYTIVATQNPIEQEGTYRLPEAQMDRFVFKITVGYPDSSAEKQVLKAHDRRADYNKLANVEPVLSKEDVKRLRAKARSVFVDDKIIDYIVGIVQKTRSHKDIYVGASPRASIALLNTSKAYALINGRNFVIPEDVKELALPVLTHRLILTADAEMEGLTMATVVDSIINSVAVKQE